MKIGFGLATTVIGDPAVVALDEDQNEIGRMVMSIATDWGRPNLVKWVHVDAAYRRKGIATAMWNFAKQQGLQPAHEFEKTTAGAAWAEAVGD